VPFNVDDPWNAEDTLRELCTCEGATSDDPGNQDFHRADCAGLTS
jgi:hypothetical protein